MSLAIHISPYNLQRSDLYAIKPDETGACDCLLMSYANKVELLFFPEFFDGVLERLGRFDDIVVFPIVGVSKKLHFVEE